MSFWRQWQTPSVALHNDNDILVPQYSDLVNIFWWVAPSYTRNKLLFTNVIPREAPALYSLITIQMVRFLGSNNGQVSYTPPATSHPPIVNSLPNTRTEWCQLHCLQAETWLIMCDVKWLVKDNMWKVNCTRHQSGGQTVRWEPNTRTQGRDTRHRDLATVAGGRDHTVRMLGSRDNYVTTLPSALISLECESFSAKFCI